MSPLEVAARPLHAPAQVEGVTARAYTIPTQAPESDGTLEWNSTTLVVALVDAGGLQGVGYTYGDASAADLIERVLAPLIRGRDADATGDLWDRCVQAVRNIGRRGIAGTAISALDTALWDARARRLGVSLATLLGRYRDRVPAYASGGFTSASDDELEQQLAGWAREGFSMVKMKVGRDADADRRRVARAREAIGDDVALFVDANGAHAVQEAASQAAAFARYGVSWFEEPVSSDDLSGLREVRERAPAGMAIAAGEYLYDPWEARAMLEARAVDVLQLDATRSCGVTGFMRCAAVADSFHVPVSAHTAPTLHAHLLCATPRAAHVEYFHDHARIEQMLFDGAITTERGTIAPSNDRSGLGISLRHEDAERYRSA